MAAHKLIGAVAVFLALVATTSAQVGMRKVGSWTTEVGKTLSMQHVEVLQRQDGNSCHTQDFNFFAYIDESGGDLLSIAFNEFNSCDGNNVYHNWMGYINATTFVVKPTRARLVVKGNLVKGYSAPRKFDNPPRTVDIDLTLKCERRPARNTYTTIVPGFLRHISSGTYCEAFLPSAGVKVNGKSVKVCDATFGTSLDVQKGDYPNPLNTCPY